MHYVLSLVSSTIAAALLYSGVLHAIQPYFFIYTLSTYRILPNAISGYVGLVLPYLQITLGLCIVCRQANRTATLIAAPLFGIFALAQGIVLARGQSLDCGCFGYAPKPISTATLLVPVMLCAACIFVLATSDKGQLKPKDR